MRIYLADARNNLPEITKEGVTILRSYPSPGFYNAPDERSQAWIDEGVAFEATEDNKVMAFRPGVDVAETIDFDAGENLDGLFSKYIPAPEPVPVPVVPGRDPDAGALPIIKPDPPREMVGLSHVVEGSETVLDVVNDDDDEEEDF